MEINYVPASDSDGPYALLGRHSDGSHSWYSGRAGSMFVEGAPYTYSSLEGARRRAGVLNMHSDAHGWWFMVVGIAQ